MIYDYIVIGAGLSGLACAWKLKQKGEKRILVLEARDRIGGRTHTDSVVVAGETINIELGASYMIGVDSNPLMLYLKNVAKMQLQTSPLNEQNVQFFDNGLVSTETARRIERCYRKFEKFLDKRCSYMKRPLLGPDESMQQVFDKWVAKKISKEEMVWVENFMCADVISDYATDPHDLSAWYFDAGEDLPENHQFLTQGFSQICNYFAQDLTIQLETVVSKIDYSANQDCAVSVTTNEGIYKAMYAVVVTVPIGVLKVGMIEFVPDLPVKKQQAIDKIGSGNLNILYIAFSRKFWDSSVHIFVNMSPNSCSKISSFWNACSLYPKHNMLLAFYAGDFGHEIEPLSSQQKESMFKEILSDCFGEYGSEVIWWRTTAWEIDPFARGSYSYLPVGAKPADIEALAAPIDGKVFFAGDATSKSHPATVHGAWLSGCQVVDNNY